MGSSCVQEGGDRRSGPEDASALRLEGDEAPCVLTDLGERAATALWEARHRFEIGEHWYQYLVGSAAEGAVLRSVETSLGLAGFIEIFQWEDGMALESLYLFPEWRRRGVGSAVVRLLEGECGNRLTIWAGRATCAFYERLGYTRDTSQGGFMMTRSGSPRGKTFTQAASQLWQSNV